MATGRVNNALNVYRITDDALPLLREKMEKWFETEGCQESPYAPLVPAECANADLLQKDLQRVFADKVLDLVEAPVFYKMMGPIQKNGVVDRTIVEQLDVGKAIDVLYGVYGADWGEGGRSKEESYVLLRHVDDGHIHLFRPHNTRQSRVKESMKIVVPHLRGWRREIERVHFDVREHEQEGVLGFQHFVGPSNLWGLASLITGGSTFSAEDDETYLDLLARLETICVGAALFAGGFEKGVLPLEERAVQTFLASPFAEFSDLNYLFGVDAKATQAGDREWREALEGLVERSGLHLSEKDDGSGKKRMFFGKDE